VTSLSSQRVLAKKGLAGLGALAIAAGFSMSTASAASLTHVNPGSETTSAKKASLVPLLQVGPVINSSPGQAPPSNSYCLAHFQIACYGPSDMANEYNFTSAYAQGYKGQGQSIVIFDSYGSPTIQKDLTIFDAAYHLPPPPAFNIYEPEGKVVLHYNGLATPAFHHPKQVANQIGWAYETTLDVEYAHAMAPDATIDLVLVPVAETYGVHGMWNMENAQRWAMDNHIGNIWSNSWATAEQTFTRTNQLMQLNKLYQQASEAGISSFFAAGDTGAANTNAQGVYYPYPTVNYPSSSQYVISVGGTEIPSTPEAITTYTPESVWNDGFGAGGGGYSAFFPEPAFQQSAGLTNPNLTRGLPDVSYNAAVLSAVLIYESFDPIAGAGWVPIGGTSAATPQWAAVDAVAQSALGNLGYIAPTLYRIYENPALYAQAFHDITSGNNSFAGITGYNASTGWDPASGLGTPNVAGLIQAIRALQP
jgi:subtilase family serine protease